VTNVETDPLPDGQVASDLNMKGSCATHVFVFQGFKKPKTKK